MSSVLFTWGVAWAATTADCDNPTTNDDVTKAVHQATLAYEALEVERFREATGALEDATRCLGETLSPGNAAEFHRIEGLAAFLDSQAVICKKSFAAARAVEPEYSFPTALVPPGNPVLELYTAIDLSGTPVQALPYPKEGTIRIDGSPQLERHPGLPAVFQRIDAAGVVIQTMILGPSEPVPEYPSRKGPGPKGNSKKPLKRALLISGLGTLAVAGGVYGAAYSTKVRWKNARADPNGTYNEVETLYDRNLQLLIGSIGVAAVGVGLSTSSFALSGRF